MLASSTARALVPASGALGVGMARIVGPRLADLLSNRGFAKDAGSTYEGMKEAARKTGDAAKEWLTGTSQHAHSVQEKLKQNAESAYKSTKRAAEDMTRDAHEAASKRGFEEMREKASQAVQGAQNKAGEVASQAVDAAKEAVGGGGSPKLESARAVWEATRDEGQKAEEQSSRKSQLTDEAHGDNPAESTPRDDKQILESDFYTKA